MVYGIYECVAVFELFCVSHPSKITFFNTTSGVSDFSLLLISNYQCCERVFAIFSSLHQCLSMFRKDFHAFTFSSSVFINIVVLHFFLLFWYFRLCFFTRFGTNSFSLVSDKVLFHCWHFLTYSKNSDFVDSTLKFCHRCVSRNTTHFTALID